MRYQSIRMVPGRGSSIVDVTRFQLQQFTVSIKKLAEWFGLKVARIVVDECMASRAKMNGQVPPTLLSQV